MKRYGIADKSIVSIWEVPNETRENEAGLGFSAIADEVLYGMAFSVTGETENGFYPVRTFYGYEGYVKEDDFKPVSLQELQDWENGNLMAVNGIYTDVLSLPKVQGIKLMGLFKGALIKVLDFNWEDSGWAKAELLDGRTGYMRNQFLQKKEFSQAGLWTGELPQKKIVDENTFRKAVVETARQYLEVQYRWGGKSTAGIDCSGLTSMSYLLNGILTYRDAKIKPGFPVHEISREEMLPGDFMYFPGHIAMYMGDGSYIHSTGKTGSGGVVINSFDPEAADYRADLAKSWYATGSIF